jgi:hypothetical protein
MAWPAIVAEPRRGGDEQMREISAAQARHDFGVTTKHHEMDNGERRFRLLKNDGTAYSRTEATEAGGWQRSHFHKAVMETYIVQAGWVAFAELISSELTIRILGAGDTVTTKPMVVHNVYLSSDAVIHTVKHGPAQGDDRHADDSTAGFDLATRALTTTEAIHAAAIRVATAPAEYSDAYRHFDNLIWQIPAWSTAVFALAVQSLFGVLDTSNRRDINAATMLAVFTALALWSFAFVMSRFRMHQRALKAHKTSPLFSASTLTQALVLIESSIMIGAALLLQAVSASCTIIVTTVAATFSLVLFELIVRRLAPRTR